MKIGDSLYAMVRALQDHRIRRFVCASVMGFFAIALGIASCGAMVPGGVQIAASRTALREGGTLSIHAQITTFGTKGATRISRFVIWPSVDGKQWGAAENTDQYGRATLMLPLPNPGLTRIQVSAKPQAKVPSADCYNLHLNNDIEPTSLTACAYRGCGGWGFYYLNLTRAMINLYRQKQLHTTILAVGVPHREQGIHSRSLFVRWACAGKQPRSFTLKLDGKVVIRHIPSSRRTYTLRLPHLVPGRHTLVLEAVGGLSRFRLSYTREARRLPHLIPAKANVEFLVR